ncbi:MAG: GNAT family acetyltransferase [Lachnospiraceae bacterium]|nr:GNAT family acetyltransferase [Lachnospiraceae bacterium]MCM1215633.1 GNAT family acetyltransferase [Lachnospiraceae bacterium]MCM1238497.1 GNAT family acetyltransferase [Lachnospiraceae bacterium]MCM1343877.1 hypothetical protein [Muribaculaceae bacterium]MCM1411297.1 GNAT family acetyltransferase [Lachnospiraceae bacterium]
MKYLIMCEGSNEKKVIDMLLEHGKLKVSADDLLGRITYHARQIKSSPMIMGQLRIYGGDVEVWRIGDKQTDKLIIPAEFRTQIKKVTKFCTLPELEILLILSERKFKEYEKGKSQKHPKDFAKENIFLNRRRYKGETQFYEEYYGTDINKLIKAILEYKQRNHAHKADEHYLMEILER